MSERTNPERSLSEDARSVEAVVVRGWDEGNVALRLESGDERSMPVPEALREHFDVGRRVMLYLDAEEVLLGWYLPEQHVGLDLRGG